MYEQLRRDLSFIQGLLEGSAESRNTTETKVLSRLSEAVDLLVEQTKELERRLLNLEEYVEELDEDLEELEELFVDDEDEEGEEETVEITCPECGEEVLVDVEDLEDETLELLCPKCHTVLVMEDAEGKLDEVTKENGD